MLFYLGVRLLFIPYAPLSDLLSAGGCIFETLFIRWIKLCRFNIGSCSSSSSRITLNKTLIDKWVVPWPAAETWSTRSSLCLSFSLHLHSQTWSVTFWRFPTVWSNGLTLCCLTTSFRRSSYTTVNYNRIHFLSSVHFWWREVGSQHRVAAEEVARTTHSYSIVRPLGLRQGNERESAVNIHTNTAAAAAVVVVVVVVVLPRSYDRLFVRVYNGAQRYFNNYALRA